MRTEDREILEMALHGYTIARERADARIAEIQARLDGTQTEAVKPKPPKGKWTPAMRRRQSEKLKARWAKWHKAQKRA